MDRTYIDCVCLGPYPKNVEVIEITRETGDKKIIEDGCSSPSLNGRTRRHDYLESRMISRNPCELEMRLENWMNQTRTWLVEKKVYTRLN
jgi:hypothetical protein